MGIIQRHTLATDIEKDADGFVQQCEIEGLEPHQLMERESPASAVELRPGESPDAAGSVAERLGVTLRSNPRRKIYSTPMKEVVNHPAKLMAAKACTKLNFVNKLRLTFDRENFDSHQLQFGVTDFQAGGPFNPYNMLPLRDGTKLKVFPPMSAIVGNTNVIGIGEAFLIPEYKEPPAANDDSEPVEWEPGTDIPLGRLSAVQSQLQPRWYAGGFMLTSELRQSSLGAELMMIRSDKEAIKLSRQVVTQSLQQVVSGVKTEDLVPLGAEALTVEDILEIAMAYNGEQEDYMITTLFGTKAIIKEYLGIPRDKLALQSSSPTPAGMMAGGDVYGGAPANRMVYDIGEDRVDGIQDDSLYGIDAGETVDLTVQSGSDEETETYSNRARVWEVAWTLKYLSHLRTPDSGNPIKRFRKAA